MKTILPTNKLFANKLIKAFAFCFPLFFLAACDNQTSELLDDIWDGSEDDVCEEDVTSVDFKQIAYWSISDEETLDDIDFTKLTHVIYNKIGVESNGNLILPTGEDLDEFKEMIDLAHTSNIYAMASIGNASDSAFNSIAGNTTALNDFIANVENLIKDYDLDGIDINWQFPTTDDEGDLFEDLVKEVSDLTTDQGVLFSYVVDSGEDDDATDQGVQEDALGYPDFVNVMALNTTDNDELHSSLEDAKEAITYWTNRCVVKNKIVLAIPVYSQGDAVLDFNDIVSDDLDNACVDEATNVEGPSGNIYDNINYNGIATVIAKTAYAQTKAGGVILNAVNQDYVEDADYSLLNTMYLQSIYQSNTICD
ncbi:glycoside hydrolase family 18 protein [Psychromonas arctica]|uniref:glycoside hydrolase family 18 protein n=1 Tax=Psychromonas arctica TaxID=168275 RepID=UPI000402E697|nr:glycoside hydrolase family 18 protein [Psychromonas arctica]